MLLHMDTNIHGEFLSIHGGNLVSLTRMRVLLQFRQFQTLRQVGQVLQGQILYPEDAGYELSVTIKESASEIRVKTGRLGWLPFVATPTGVSSVLFGIERPTGTRGLVYDLNLSLVPAEEACLEDLNNNNAIADAFAGDFGVRELSGRICPGDSELHADYFVFQVPAQTESSPVM